MSTSENDQAHDDVLKLIIEDDEGSQANYPLLHEEVRVGRASDNQVCLAQRNVSRFHALMTLQSSRSALLVEDLESYTGIKLNGQKISNQCTFRIGDLIEIGDYVLSLQSSAESAQSDHGSDKLAKNIIDNVIFI